MSGLEEIVIKPSYPAALERQAMSLLNRQVTFAGGVAGRVGVIAYCVADADLPDGLSMQEFRTRLERWRGVQ